jgi:hypothetical protein
VVGPCVAQAAEVLTQAARGLEDSNADAAADLLLEAVDLLEQDSKRGAGTYPLTPVLRSLSLSPPPLWVYFVCGLCGVWRVAWSVWCV